jgi:monoterpene epsilon-lactone hydrolase
VEELQQVRAALAQYQTTGSLDEARRLYDDDGARFYRPCDAVRTNLKVGGCDAEFIVPGEATARTVYYLHGGGYRLGSLTSHRHLALGIARAAGARSFAIDYRRAPEHGFPAQIDDGLAGYRYLLDTGVPPASIAFCGDSAGGNLVVTTLMAAKRAGLPMPGAAVCLSPWVDYEALGESMQTKADVDPVVTRQASLGAAEVYLGGAHPRTSAAAILGADLVGLPPLLVQVGSHEVLLDDATRLAQAAATADVEVTLQVWPRMVHVFQFYFPILSEGRQAVEEVGRFLKRHLKA